MLRFVFIATLVVLAIVPILAQAQQQMQDVVYLKNGSIIRGTIIKQVPGISIIKYLDKITSLFFNYLLLVILRSAAKPVPSLRSRTSSKLAAGKNLMS